MKRVLVTGGSGFVGANLVRRLLTEGHEVHLLVRPHGSMWRLDGVLSEVQVHWADLENPEAVGATVARSRPEWVFNLAAYGAYPSQQGIGRMIATNLVGTVNLLEAALASGFEAFVHTGSSSEYGFKPGAPDEATWLEPNSDYSVSKAAATQYCRYRGRQSGARVSTVRLYSVYGPWEEPTRFVPRLVVEGLDGRLPPLVGPSVARDFVYVEDVLDAYLLTAATAAEPGGVYNVGTGVQTRLSDAVETARGVLAIDAEPCWGTMPARAWDTDAWVADAGLIQRTLGWHPRHDFKSGLAAFVDWFRTQPEVGRHYGGGRDRHPEGTVT